MDRVLLTSAGVDMCFSLGRFLLVLSAFFLVLGFSSSANATYYNFYSSYSFSSYSSYGSYSRYKRSYRWGSRGYYKKKKRKADKKPIARADHYTLDVGTLLNQNVITENDFQGDAPATAKLISGTLPIGVTLAADGSLTGTPTEVGVFIVTYKLRDKDGDYSTCTVKIVVEDNNLLPEAVDDSYSGEVGMALSQNVIDENDTQGDGVASAMLTGGSLPNGVSLASNGSLTGAPDAPGLYTANYKITDADGDMSSAVITIVVDGDLAFCPQAADGDDLSDGAPGQAVDIPLISSGLRFVDAPTADQTFPDGDLVISGVMEDDAGNSFTLNLTYSGLQASPDVPPVLNLNPSAYVDQGGPIDPSEWQFFDSVSGNLFGITGAWNGVSLEVNGSDIQLGLGANGKNANLGLFGSVTLTVLGVFGPPPAGINNGDQLDANVNIDLLDECPAVPKVVEQLCAVDAPKDAYGQYSDGHALDIRFPGINRSFVFDPAGMIAVFDNGDLVITGNATNGESSFDVELTYSDFMDDTPGTPKRELIPSAYIEAGGPIDPSTWDFYGSVEGTLTGTGGDVDGVVLDAAPIGPIAQIGFGANGKNFEYGLSNWFTFTVLSAPDSASVDVGDSFPGDANININSDCIEDENLVPLAVDDSYTVEVGGEVLIANILDNDTDGDGQSTLSFNPADLPAGITLSADGLLVGVPEEGAGEYQFNYTITDEDGDMSTATVTIIVTIGTVPT